MFHIYVLGLYKDPLDGTFIPVGFRTSFFGRVSINSTIYILKIVILIYVNNLLTFCGNCLIFPGSILVISGIALSMSTMFLLNPTSNIIQLTILTITSYSFPRFSLSQPCPNKGRPTLGRGAAFSACSPRTPCGGCSTRGWEWRDGARSAGSRGQTFRCSRIAEDMILNII